MMEKIDCAEKKYTIEEEMGSNPQCEDGRE